MKRALRGLALSCAVLGALFVASELGLRLVGYEHAPPPPIVVWTRDQDTAFEKERALFMRHPSALWTLRPGARIERPPVGVPGSGELVNEGGFRGPLIERQRVPGRLRVATLGDSSTFGYGVLWEDTWSARLAEELAARGHPAEILCAGVVGYTIAQGVERYVADVRPYRPDVVVAAFGAVNEHFPDALPDREKMAWLARPRSAAFEWAREHLRLVHFALDLRERFSGGQAPEHEPGGARVSLESFGAELRALLDAVRADGAALVVVVPPRRAASEERTPVLLEYTAALRRFVAERSLPSLDAHELFHAWPEGEDELLLDLYHPDPRGHALLAEELAPVVIDAAEASGALR